MKKTKIDWADSTWNPVTGCLHGCKYCYAHDIALRFGATYSEWNTEAGHEYDVYEGTGEIHELDMPCKREWKNGKVTNAPYPFCFDPTFHKYRLDELRHWKKPRNIFVCSMADLFGNWVPEKWIQEVFRACEAAPQHRYIFLTKNPARLMKMYSARRFNKLKEKYPDGDIPEEIRGITPMPGHDNWWFGSTVTNKNMGFAQGSILDHNFISIEPLQENLNVGLGSFGGVKWIIIGAETGNRKGKIIPKREWVENICEAAAITGAKVFMKESLREIMGDDFRQEFPW